MNTEDIFRIAPCLRTGPLAAAGNRLQISTNLLPDTRYAAVQKTWAAYYLFKAAESAFNAPGDPTYSLNTEMDRLAEMLTKASLLLAPFLGASDTDNQGDSIDAVTGNHYCNLFKAWDDEHYFQEAVDLLGTRLIRNDIDLSKISDWNVLDAGCGGGRYSAAWSKLGAKSVTGLDFSEENIATARERMRLNNVTFKHGNVLDMPFEDNSYDVVFCNGVLHHTPDWKRGVGEIVRVLKPGGLGWLYLIENPGGYFWDVIEILRTFMLDVDKELARASLRLIGVPQNRIYYILDHIQVPINTRITEAEIEETLAEHGAAEIRKFQRGADFDRIEHIYQGVPYARMKYGVGENRYTFTKAVARG